uniref:Uncharacterized protein n=1 Tax=Anguilla anguilla TaxID=7936 RepID=A0A0E9QLB2_ANGAN
MAGISISMDGLYATLHRRKRVIAMTIRVPKPLNSSLPKTHVLGGTTQVMHKN